MKKLFTTLFALSFLFALSAGATGHLSGKTIALDAGHGSSEIDTGAVGYCGETAVKEVEVNEAARDGLAAKLAADGAGVFFVPQLSSRRERVQAAEDAGADVLISIHHNGSNDTTVDYTQSFITQNKDKKFAQPIHEALVAALEIPDAGIKHDGYGMTVYGSMPAVLTESFFITNTWEACSVEERIPIEIQAMYDGLNAYFASGGSGDGGGGGDCSPGKQKQGKC